MHSFTAFAIVDNNADAFSKVRAYLNKCYSIPDNSNELYSFKRKWQDVQKAKGKFITNIMSQALVVAILNRWHTMVENLLNFCEANIIKLTMTDECVGVLIAHNSYKHMRMLIASQVSVSEGL